MRLWNQYRATVRANWHLGLTCFGGPAVQFQTFHKRFVEDLKWIDEPMFQQIFCLAQSLPGSATMKMLLCINAVRHGLAAGFLAIAMFILPGAFAMYALAIGVSKLQSSLPPYIYALLSGFNAAALGLIAFAAVRLSERAVSDKLSRLLICFGGVMGMLYTSLWYYPVLMASAGLTTYIWDSDYLQRTYVKLLTSLKRRMSPIERQNRDVESLNSDWSYLDEKPLPEPPSIWPRTQRDSPATPVNSEDSSIRSYDNDTEALLAREDMGAFDVPSLPWMIGTLILVAFGITFVLVIALHAAVPSLKTRIFDVFSSLYLAGTITFGGGPVLTPLLRDYIVSPGWVTPRNFLLGFSAFQALPGPGFNFAVYLGTLAVAGTSCPSFLGATMAFVAIYTPGLCIVIGFMALWRIINGKRWFHSILRGVNAAAVGLVYAAVYKLWQISYLTVTVQSGQPLGTDPWLVLILAVVYVGSAWFRWNPPISIFLGGMLGIAKYAVMNA